MSAASPRRAQRWPVYLALVLLLIFLGAFLLLFASFTPSAAPEATYEVAEFSPKVTLLLNRGRADHGAELLVEFQCVNCHFSGAGNVIAPPFAGIAERAAERRPPLTAAEYLYESITRPLAYIVSDYAPAMPQNFDERLTDQQMADMIVYLLTQ
jgi:hypothetical protein